VAKKGRNPAGCVQIIPSMLRLGPVRCTKGTRKKERKRRRGISGEIDIWRRGQRLWKRPRSLYLVLIGVVLPLICRLHSSSKIQVPAGWAVRGAITFMPVVSAGRCWRLKALVMQVYGSGLIKPQKPGKPLKITQCV